MTSDDVRRRDALERTVSARLMACSLDELRVMDFVLGRLEVGRDRYGHLDLAKHETRSWRRDRAEELGDAVVYTAFDAIVEHDKRVEAITGRSLWADAADAVLAAHGQGSGCVACGAGVPHVVSSAEEQAAMTAFAEHLRGRVPRPEVVQFVHSMATAGDEVAPPSAVTDPERAAGDPERAPLTKEMP